MVRYGTIRYRYKRVLLGAELYRTVRYQGVCWWYTIWYTMVLVYHGLSMVLQRPLGSVAWSPKSSWTPWWSITWSLFVNNVHQTLWLTGFGGHRSRTLANCSRKVFTKKSQNGVWWTVFTNFGKLFTKSVHQKEQKRGLVKSVHELWQTIHEQCLPESAK